MTEIMRGAAGAKCGYTMFSNGGKSDIENDGEVVGHARRRKDARSPGYVYTITDLRGGTIYVGSKMSEGLRMLEAKIDANAKPASASPAATTPATATQGPLTVTIRIGEVRNPAGMFTADKCRPVYIGPWYVGDLLDIPGVVRFFGRASLMRGDTQGKAEPMARDYSTREQFYKALTSVML